MDAVTLLILFIIFIFISPILWVIIDFILQDIYIDRHCGTHAGNKEYHSYHSWWDSPFE